MTETLWSYAVLGLLTLVLLPIYWLIAPRDKRSVVLLLGSLLFIGAIDLGYLAFFVVDVAVVYYLAGLIRRAEASKTRLLKVALLWLIGGLCLFKYVRPLSSLLPEGAVPSIVSSLVLPLGMSYITFRMIHYVVEVYRGKAPASSFADFAAYVLFFPTYISGPVERFPAFHKQTAAEKSFDLADVNYGLYRIISGLAKKAIVADVLLRDPVRQVLAAPAEHSPWLLLLAVYGLAMYFYMDFSGYTDIALGIGRLFGYKIMENFNWPYLKKNIAQFWRNWHISVYSFIRDYFFFPFFGRSPTTLKTSIGIFCTMQLFMLWHELSWPFIMLGFYHGAGLVAWQLTQELKRKSPALRRVLGAKAAVPISTFATFTFVSFSMLFFDYDLAHIGLLLRSLVSY